MTQVQRPSAEGWQQDPYGRHELRFFDGQRWTPYVRDGEASGLDEPGGPVADGSASAVPRSPLFTSDLLLVERFTDLGRRWSDRGVRTADGSAAGTLRRAALPGQRASGLRSVVARDLTKNDVVELVDGTDRVVLTLVRPMAAKTSVEVRDADGREAGRIVQQTLRRDETTYAFLAPSGKFVGDLRAENWVAWDLRVVDAHDRQVATITRDFTGLDAVRTERPEDYVVRIDASVNEPLRTLVVACALSLEVAVRPDARGV